MKTDWELLKVRCEWYSFIIQGKGRTSQLQCFHIRKLQIYEFMILMLEMLKLIGVPLDKLKFVRGSDFQLSRGYTLDVYKISALVTTEQTTKVIFLVFSFHSHSSLCFIFATNTSIFLS
jgi:hypothetical protein